MADISNGPVSTMPGSRHEIPEKIMCDKHPERPAVTRVQGETDSFGCEYYDMCQECLDKYRKEISEADHSGRCDWCHKHADRLYAHRDIEEGACGAVYEVCKSCIDRERENWREWREANDD
jgi:hypothetical protein